MSSIEWTTKTWNPTTGCTHYSSSEAKHGDECLNCYAEKDTYRKQFNPNLPKYKAGFDVIVEHEQELELPYTWKEPCTVFVNSMSDMFHRDISDDFILKVFKVMNETPQHTYQILTKRHTRLAKLPKGLVWPDNIWMGVSCGTPYSTKRIKALVECEAKHKFLSMEPLIREITDMDLRGIDWVIVGGESGTNTYEKTKDAHGNDVFVLDDDGKKKILKSIRPMEKQWVHNIQRICERDNVPFFFKQWGLVKNNPNPNDPTIQKGHRYHSKGGSELDGKVYWANPTIEDDSIPMLDVFGSEYMVMDEYEDLNTIWELKSYLPMMEDDLFKQLSEDIRKNGINDPILFITLPNSKKLVIEGHTRLSAGLKVKLKVIPQKEIKNTFNNLNEIKFWMIRHQFQRRNLSNIEKLDLAMRFKPEIEAMAKENLSTKNKNGNVQPIDTNEAISKIAGIGRTTVVKYSFIEKNASDSVKKKLSSENISINNAYNLAKATPKAVSKPKKTPKEVEIILYENEVDAMKALELDTIDLVIITKNESDIQKIKKLYSKRIGVFKMAIK